ncbi:hypothetical protein AB0I60_23095 [Actinosynnema sp. NPDC050436]|uniref:hypothetical protein n=1 Tax=Actinosynnema sp. NPDC050436 TaxID=3155659 RepID=UPI0033C519C0
MPDTVYTKENVKNAAINLGRILAEMNTFTDLKAHWPDAGRFPLAQWLERIVDDRRNGIVAHAEHLKLTFQKMQTTLERIVADFENVDGENARKVLSMVGRMQKTIDSEIDQLDRNTEKAQKNFTPGGGGKQNSTDGDGYNDNLDIPLGDEEPGGDDDDDDDEDDGDYDYDDDDDEDEKPPPPPQDPHGEKSPPSTKVPRT